MGCGTVQPFLAAAFRRRSMSRADAAGPRRRRAPRWGVLFVAGCLIMVLSTVLIASSDPGTWPVAAAAIGAIGIVAVVLAVRSRRDEIRLRRLEDMTARITFLVATLPRPTDVETLAVLHEIRNCYAEASELAAGFGGRGRRLAASIRDGLGKVERLYDIQSGSLRHTGENASDFARVMRELGRDVDGSLRR